MQQLQLRVASQARKVCCFVLLPRFRVAYGFHAEAAKCVQSSCPCSCRSTLIPRIVHFFLPTAREGSLSRRKSEMCQCEAVPYTIVASRDDIRWVADADVAFTKRWTRKSRFQGRFTGFLDNAPTKMAHADCSQTAERDNKGSRSRLFNISKSVVSRLIAE